MKKILVIEDETVLRDEIVEILKYKGFDVYSADNGKTGIIKALRYIPDLILCDIIMPEMDGVEVLSQIRSNKNTKLTQFVFATALADRREIRTGMLLGADDYLTKPFTIKELLATVSKCLDKAASLNNIVEEELDHLRQNIITQIPHEMRTPLHGIIGLGSFLTENPSILNAQDILEIGKTITESGNILLNTINKYFIYIQLETVPATLHPSGESNWLSGTLEETVSVMAKNANRMEDVNISLEECRLAASEYLFTVALKEIIDNAFKFSEPGSVVSVKLMKKNGLAEFKIHNKGRVFSEESIKKIGAFMQFDRSQYEQKGSGLGLAISKKIIKMFSGHLNIKSADGTGTTVTVTMPLMEEKEGLAV